MTMFFVILGKKRNSMDPIQRKLKLLLSQCFHYYKYNEAIALFKGLLANKPTYSESWDDIKALITHRKMAIGEPLHLIHYGANLSLDENSDEEAYKWLDLLVRNVETTSDDDVVEY
jgi:hypothetical protein